MFTLYGVDIEKTNVVKIVLKDNAGKEIVNTGDISLPPNMKEENIALPPEYTGYNMSMDFRNVVFEAEGEYCTEVYINGELVFTAPIYVRGKRGTGK